MIFSLSETNRVSDFVAVAENFTLDGQSLSQDFDTLVSILGESYENYGGGRYSCPVAWQKDGCEIVFELPIIETDEWTTRVFVFQATSDDVFNSVLDDLLYQGDPIAELLGKDSEQIKQILGEPTDGTPVTGELLYGGTEFYVYDGAMFMFDEQGCVFNITMDADQVEKDGQKLNQNRDKILNLLGTPDYEDQLPIDESGEGFGGYYVMEYSTYDDNLITSITVEMPDASSKATGVVINQYFETDPSYESDYDAGDYPMATDDKVSLYDVVGTWAFADGGNTTLTLYSNGTCGGRIGRRYNPDTNMIDTIVPDTWMFLEYEQVIQIPITVSSMQWDMLGKYVYESYDTELLNFKVSMVNGVLHLENTEDADTWQIEYVRVS